MFDKLPPEIRTDILSRVPVDSLLRFRCVSKSWCAQIDNPNFIKTHLKKSIASHSNLGLIFADSHPDFLCLTSFDSLENVIELDNPLNHPSNDHPQIKLEAGYFPNDISLVGSCNGLVCFTNDSEKIILINPSTRKYQVLPFLPDKMKGDWVVSNFGFGYDPNSDDYKVVKIGQGLNFRDSYSSNETMVYNLKANVWKKIPSMPYVLGFHNQRGVLLGDSNLHWLVCRNRNRIKCVLDLIVGFDLGNDEFREVPGPEITVDQKDFVKLIVLGEWLSVIPIYRGVQLDFWVMKEYGVKESWTRLFSVTSNEVPSLKCMGTFTFSNNGDELLLELLPGNLLYYNLKEKTVKRVEIHTPRTPYVAEVLCGSLVPLALPLGLNKELDPKEEQKRRKERKKRDEFFAKADKLNELVKFLNGVM